MYRQNDGGIYEIQIGNWPKNRFEASVFFSGSGERVIDIGCGNGLVLFSLQNKYSSLYGIDVSSKRCQDAQRNLAPCNAEILCADIEEGLPMYADNYFDTIISSDTIEHFVDIFDAISVMARVLKPNGRLVINTPNFAKIKNRCKLLVGEFGSTSTNNEGFGNNCEEEMHDGGHLHYFTFSMLDKLCSKYNFHKVEHYGFGPFGKFHNIIPSLLSPSCQIVAYKK